VIEIKRREMKWHTRAHAKDRERERERKRKPAFLQRKRKSQKETDKYIETQKKDRHV
jgi:hypothetical protein